MNRGIKRFAALAVLVAIVYLCRGIQERPQAVPRGNGATATAKSDRLLAEAFERRQTDVTVRGAGQVVRLLPEDDDGIRHQKFIIQLASGQRLLVAHNIDVAEKIPVLHPGDTVEFRGQYEWNNQGGIVHWTHLDRDGRHPPGWLKHAGHIYQ